MTDKIAKAYMAMKRPKLYPALQTVFGKHSAPLEEAITVSHSYVMDDPLHDTKERDRLHKDHSIHMDEDALKDIRGYTTLSFMVNSALHKHYNDGEIFDHESIGKAKNIEKILDKHEAKENFHVYTGLRHSPFKAIANVNGNHMVHLPAFTSTSTSFRKASSFSAVDKDTKHDANVHGGIVEPMAKHVLKIHVHPGVSIASVRDLSENKHEHEMLMNRGYDLKIDPSPVKAKHEGGSSELYVWNAYPVSRKVRTLEPKDSGAAPAKQQTMLSKALGQS